MGTTRILPRLLLICSLVASSLAFVLHKRPREESGANRLAEALKVLAEERQRLREQEDDPRLYDQPYFWAGNRNVADEDNEEAEEEEALTSDLLHRLLSGTEGSMDELPADSELDTEVLEPGQKRSSSLGSNTADIAELQDILEPSDDEVKRSEKKRQEKKSIPFQLGGPPAQKGSHKREYDPSSLPFEKKSQNGEEEDEEEPGTLSASEVQTLLDEADKTELNEMEESPDVADTEEVDKDELAEVLKGDADEEDDNTNQWPPLPSEEDRMDINTGGDWSEYPANGVGLNKEWLLNQYLDNLQAGAPTIKQKRSERKRPSSSLVGSGDVQDQVSLAREYIKKFLELEDDENTNLANALNLATLAQVQRDDKLIPAEIQFLRKAIGDEERIQALKDAVEGGDLEEDEDLAEKRTDLLDEDVPELAEEDENFELGEPPLVDDDVADVNAEVDEEEREAFRQFLKNRFNQYMMRTGSFDAPSENIANEVNVPTYEESMGKWYDEPVRFNQEGLEDKDGELNPFIRDLYEKFQTGQLSKRGGVYPEDDGEEEGLDLPEDDNDIAQDTENEIDNTLSDYLPGAAQLAVEEAGTVEDFCPALKMVDDCALAINLNLRLDEEAMDLCNRHQLCYMCGAAHGLSGDDCDNGYLDEAERLCSNQENDDDCKDDAAGLYLIMLKAHAYVRPGSTNPVCESRCTVEYVAGLDLE